MQINRKQNVVWFKDAEIRNVTALGTLTVQVDTGLWVPFGITVGDGDNEYNVKTKSLHLDKQTAADLIQHRRLDGVKVRDGKKSSGWTLIIDDVTAGTGRLI